MKNVNEDLVRFASQAKKYGLTYGQLQQRETLLRIRRTQIDKSKYRRVGNGKSDFYAEGENNNEQN